MTTDRLSSAEAPNGFVSATLQRTPQSDSPDERRESLAERQRRLLFCVASHDARGNREGAKRVREWLAALIPNRETAARILNGEEVDLDGATVPTAEQVERWETEYRERAASEWLNSVAARRAAAQRQAQGGGYVPPSLTGGATVGEWKRLEARAAHDAGHGSSHAASAISTPSRVTTVGAARPRGAGRPRGRSARSSSTSGGSDDGSGSSDEPPPSPAATGPRPLDAFTYLFGGRPSSALQARLTRKRPDEAAKWWRDVERIAVRCGWRA
jgi:hypothetical protein